MVADATEFGPRGAASGPDSSLAALSAPPGWEIFFTDRGAQLLAELETMPTAGDSPAAARSRLRGAGLTGDEVAALLTQTELRRKAHAKFGEAATRMLFTQAGLEQASRAIVSAQHARRFAAAGLSRVADLGCGIGTESIALLGAGVGVLAVEIDPFTAQLAAYNLGLGHSSSLFSTSSNGGTSSIEPVASFIEPVEMSATFQVLTADATTVSLAGVDGVFLDPARRTAGHRDTRRITRHHDYSPSLDFAFSTASRLPTGIKLGPGLDRSLIPDAAEAQWVSVDGQVVEMGLWFGAVAQPGVKRSALVLRSDRACGDQAGITAHELTAPADSHDADTRPLGEYLYEPDGAVIRARLIGLLAEQLGAGMVSEGIAYLTADHHIATPFAQAFRVLEQLPAGEKHLKRALTSRGIGRLEIKKRGVDVDPAALRTRLRLKGANAATLILTRAAGRHTAILAERV